MVNIIMPAAGNEVSVVQSIKSRGGAIGKKITSEVRAIMEDVRDNGWEAAVAYSLKFDGAEPYEVSKKDIERAAAECPRELYASMEKAARNIRDYQSRLMPEGKVWNVSGGVLGQLVRGLSRVGVYAPGGTAAYPSSVLMCAIPAQVAGVEEIILVTPPTKNLNAAVMAAAKIAGIHRVIAIGGAQAIASLTYGAGIVPKVDKLVGPGNAYVAAAKKLAFGELDIDMVAGPSEILIIADEGANPVYCAADLLSQAEHDVLAASILVTDSEELARAVNAELKKQTATLSRREIIRKSLADYGAIIVVEDLDRAVTVANAVAPEHLEIITKDPWQLMPKIKNAGAIFLGESSPEPLGDYLAGPSHVLPTAGTARYFSPLSVESFIKRTSLIEYTRQGLRELSQDIIRFAEAEGLDAHANSVKVRFEKTK
jgi:histidinol dehydrogenase